MFLYAHTQFQYSQGYIITDMLRLYITCHAASEPLRSALRINVRTTICRPLEMR